MAAFPKDPIIAIATPPGRGGIGIVRMSGKNLEPLVGKLFAVPLIPRHAHYLDFNDARGRPIDAGVALFFKGPNSYTGEDVLELQGHGGPAVLRRLLDRCLELGQDLGMRRAQPGEFTRRAFLNDRLDLAQAEAVADLIDATSEAAARSAMASLSGIFSRRINDLSKRIVHLRTLVEATLDFPEEEIDFLEKYQARPILQGILGELELLMREGKQGAILREGLHVVLAGQPNVGKSSLLNALAGDDIAIVTPVAGTTRDQIIQQIHIDGVPIHIVDTAGLRDTSDAVETIGIARTWAAIEKADVVVHLHDIRYRGDPLDSSIARRLPPHMPVLDVFNKIDLANASDACFASSGNTIFISAMTGAGLDALKHRLLEIAGWNPSAESPWLARERHLQALHDVGDHLASAADHAAHSDQALDLFAEELRLAHNELNSITGRFSSDDLLGEIFSSFCIGK